MPLVRCEKDGKPGWKYGKNNKTCYTYRKGNKRSETLAKLKAIKQGYIIAKRMGEKFEP